jgi:hypothetical protein
LRAFSQAFSAAIAFAGISGIAHDPPYILIIIHKRLIDKTLMVKQIFFIVYLHAFWNINPLRTWHAVSACGTVDFQGISQNPFDKLYCFHLFKAQ